MYDFEYCMKQECKVCSKQLECERGESNSKRAELKKDNKQREGERIARKISNKKKRKY